jgi:uncharacterized protein (DUF488 family)
MARPQLFTAGYEGFAQEDFLWKIKLHGVQVVVDVRQNPVSRNRGFTQSRLRTFLEENGIEYVHIQELGVPDRLRKELRAGKSLRAYFHDYGIYLRTQAEAIEGLASLAGKKICCLLCLERKPEECHRSVLATVLTNHRADQLQVTHI